MEDVLLECQVCFERYDSDSRRPKILTCGHTFCLSCLCASDSKCPTCRISFKVSPLALPDNFILLSAQDNASASRKKAFWCLDCKKGADTECEDSHTICSMKKIVAEQMGDVSEKAQEQLGAEEKLLTQLLCKLSAVKAAMQNLGSAADREVMSYDLAKDEIAKILQTIPNIENNPKGDSLELLQSQFKCSENRLTVYEKKNQLLDLLSDCEILVKPSSGSEQPWTVKLNTACDDIADEHIGLYYFLYKVVGRQYFDLPEVTNITPAGDTAAAIPNQIPPSPNGTCVIQVSQNSEHLGQIVISVTESIPSHKKDILLKGLNGVKLFPKLNNVALSGSLRTDLFLTNSKQAKIAKGSVSIARSPLQPLCIFVDKPPSSISKSGMFVWGRVVENISLLESIIQRWETRNQLVVLSNPRWL